MTQAELCRVLDWADKKLAGGAEPPWAWYQYAKLREAVEEVIACLQAPQNGESTSNENTSGWRSPISGFQSSARSV